MTGDKYSEIIKIGSTPINENNPVGDSVSYDPDYELIESEINKLQSLSREQVRWKQIIETGTDILRNKSKDLTVASWFCFALLKEAELEGLAVGLNIYYDLLDNYWESLFPAMKRMRRRVNIIEWLFENMNKTISNMPLKVENNFKLCNDFIIRITKFLDEKLGDDSPYHVFNEIKRNLSAKIKEEEEKLSRATAAEKKPVPTEKPASSAPSLIGEGTINDAETANKALKQALSIIKKSVIFLQNKEDSNPLYYRLTRMAIWSTISNLPLHNNFITQIPAIQKEFVNIFRELEEKGNWQVLLKRVEAQFINTPLWLDIQRYASISAENLGEKYDPVKAVIDEETSLFINRFPDIIQLKFIGGTPFASDETKVWIEGLTKQKPSAQTDSEKKESEDDTLVKQEKAIKEVRSLIARNKLAEAIKTWNRDYTHDGSGKGNFIAKLELAKMFVAAKKYKEAVFQLEILDEELKHFDLEKWDPVLATDVVKLLIQSIQSDSQTKTPEQANKLNALKKRLYKLDMAEALSVV